MSEEHKSSSVVTIEAGLANTHLDAEPQCRSSAATAQRLQPSLDTLPAELRLVILEHAFEDLTEELPDYLFRILHLYDEAYDYTADELSARVGQTGLTRLLLTNKQICEEALQLLYSQTTFVVHVMGEPDTEDNDRLPRKLNVMPKHLPRVKHLKLNISPINAETSSLLLQRLMKLFKAFEYGGELRTLQILVDSAYTDTTSNIWTVFCDLMRTLKVEGVVEVFAGGSSVEEAAENGFEELAQALNG